MGPRFIIPFKISACVDRVAYRLDLPDELIEIHNTFHVSHFRKCVADDYVVIMIDNIQVDVHLNYVENPIAIVNRKN